MTTDEEPDLREEANRVIGQIDCKLKFIGFIRKSNRRPEFTGDIEPLLTEARDTLQGLVDET